MKTYRRITQGMMDRSRHLHLKQRKKFQYRDTILIGGETFIAIDCIPDDKFPYPKPRQAPASNINQLLG